MIKIGGNKEELTYNLPEQKGFFGTAKLKKSTRAGTQLPDPTKVLFGYDANSQFRHIFPALNLPILLPPPKIHPEIIKRKLLSKKEIETAVAWGKLKAIKFRNKEYFDRTELFDYLKSSFRYDTGN